MKCLYCTSDSPENLLLISKSWTCPTCLEKPHKDFLPLKVELSSKYKECRQVEGTRLLYISDLENNLWKIEKYFNECLDLDNPYCTITLSLVDHIDRLVGDFDGVYIDRDINDKEGLINHLPIKEFGYVKFVEPIRQTLC